MEYENEYGKENKVGAGILIICILHFIGSTLGIIALLLGPALITPEIATQYGLTKESMTASVIPSIILAIVYVVACIMLLAKQKIGVFVYFFAVLANIIVTIALNGFLLRSLIMSLILPILMAVFISKKKELYGLGTK